MNRTDRLVAIVMLLQSRRVITAAQLAEHFEITERTVYRDLAALGETGVPVIGEPGVGYSLMRGYQLPPVMFSQDEAFALVTGGLLVERITDASMREATRSAIGKVTAVLPAGLQDRIERLSKKMLVRNRQPTEATVSLSAVQMAMAEGRVLRLHYAGAARGEPTLREIEPLGLVFYLDHWHLIAWCRLRTEVRDFRVDRIIQFEVAAEMSPPRPEFILADYLKQTMRSGSTESARIVVPERLIETVRRFWGPTVTDEQVSEGNVTVQLAYNSCGTDYFAHWLLGMGTQVKVLEPASLQESVAELARKTAEHHQPQS